MEITRRKFNRIAGASIAASLVSREYTLANQSHADSTPATSTDEHEHYDHATPQAADGTGTSAAYMEITNTGDLPDVLITGETEVAETVEIHTMEMDGDVMKMMELEDGLEIPAGETVTLESGGYHVMLINLTRTLNKGDEFTLGLTFERAGDIELNVKVETEAPEGDPVAVDDIEIAGAFARPAPKLGGDDTSIPGATPDHTDH